MRLSLIRLSCKLLDDNELFLYMFWSPLIRSRRQSGGEPSLVQRVPEKYFVVPNDDYVRVKYILVFNKIGYVPKQQSWLMRHKFVVVIIVYVILLLVLSLPQSKFFKQVLKRS